jgi:uncharacterized protein with GYD domain
LLNVSEVGLVTHVLLMSWTNGGIEKVRAAAQVAKDGDAVKGPDKLLKGALIDLGGELAAFYHTSGAHDMVAVIRVDTDAAATALALWLTNELGIETIAMPAEDPNVPPASSTPGAPRSFAGALWRCYSSGSPDDGDQ